MGKREKAGTALCVSDQKARYETGHGQQLPLATRLCLDCNAAANKTVQMLVKMESKHTTTAKPRAGPVEMALPEEQAVLALAAELGNGAGGEDGTEQALGMLGSFADPQLLFLRPVRCPTSLDDFSCSFIQTEYSFILLGGGLQREGRRWIKTAKNCLW